MDSQTLQTLLVAVVIAVAALFLGTRWYRTFASSRKKSGPGCGGDCGCSSGH
jgi:hypothetical protein